MNKRKFELKLSVEIVEITSDGNKPTLEHSLKFIGHSPALHEAIRSMGTSFIHGISVSLPSEIIEDVKPKKDSI